MKGWKLPVFVVGPGNQVHKTHRKGVSKARVIIITGSCCCCCVLSFFSHMEMWSECMVFSSLIRGYCDLSSGVSLWRISSGVTEVCQGVSLWGISSGVTEVCQGVSLWHFIRSYWGLSSGGFSVAFHQELLKHFIRGYCVVFYQGISMCFFIMGYRGLSSGVTVVFHPGLLFSLSSGVTIQSLIRGYCSFSSWVTLLSSGVTLRSVIRNYTVCFFLSGVTVVFHQGLLFSLSSGVTVVFHQGLFFK